MCFSSRRAHDVVVVSNRGPGASSGACRVFACCLPRWEATLVCSAREQAGPTAARCDPGGRVVVVFRLLFYWLLVWWAGTLRGSSQCLWRALAGQASRQPWTFADKVRWRQSLALVASMLPPCACRAIRACAAPTRAGAPLFSMGPSASFWSDSNSAHTSLPWPAASTVLHAARPVADNLHVVDASSFSLAANTPDATLHCCLPPSPPILLISPGCHRSCRGCVG